MKVRVQNVNGRGAVTIERPDADGDVMFDVEDWGCYYNVASVRRVIQALERAIAPRRGHRAASQEPGR